MVNNWEKEVKKSFSVSAMGNYAGNEDWVESLVYFIKNLIKTERKEAKIELLREYISWIKENPDDAPGYIVDDIKTRGKKL